MVEQHRVTIALDHMGENDIYHNSKKMSPYQNNRNSGLSLVEIMVTVVIVSVLAGLGIARYRDFDTTKSFDRIVDQTVVNINQARSLANAQNSKDCGVDARLASTTFRQLNNNTSYEILFTCEGNYRFGTPTPSPISSFSPTLDTTLGSGLLFLDTGPRDIATFFADGTALPGVNIRLYSPNTTMCACIRVRDAAGAVQKTTRDGCVLTQSPLNITCNVWQ